MRLVRDSNTTPPAPIARAISDTQIDLSWSEVTGNPHYRLFRATNRAGTDEAEVYSGAERSFMDMGLTASTTYYYTLEACTDGSASTCTERSAVRRITTPPGAPTTLTATVTSTSQIELGWSESGGANYYRLYRATRPDGSGGTQIYAGNRVGYSDTGLTTNTTTYYYELRACTDRNIGSCSAASDTQNATPAVPAAPNTDVQSHNRIDLSWQAVDGTTLYRLYRDTSASGGYPEIHTDSSTRYSDTGLDAGTTYHYRLVTCANTEMDSCSEQSATANATTAPPPPMGVSATIVAGAIDVEWDLVNGATHYEVWRAPQADGSNRARVEENVSQPSPAVGPVNYSDTTHAATWYYWLKACSASGCSGDSARSEAKYRTRLNDTGMTFGGNATSSTRSRCRSDFDAPQDCDQGRDAQNAAGELRKVGRGAVGFDFTKLESDGDELARQRVAWSNSGNEGAGSQWACVRDNHTGLVWEVKTDDGGIHDKDITYVWNEWSALVNGSNDASLCGLTNWRAPTVKELLTIVYREQSGVTIDTALFPNTEATDYWSSSRHVGTTAHGISFANATVVNNLPRSVVRAVRLVSSVHDESGTDSVYTSTPDVRYTTVGNGTVIDNETGLMWQQCIAGSSGDSCETPTNAAYTWQAALEYAASSEFAGYNDWRLPNVHELHSLVSFDRIEPAMNVNVFPGAPSANHWSSTPSRGRADRTWVVQFQAGRMSEIVRSAANQRVRLVRDAKVRTAPTISVQGSDQLDITWPVVAGATYYRLYRSSTVDGAYSQILLADVATRQYSDTGLAAGSTWYYRVAACTGTTETDCSAWSAPVGETTLLNDPPGGLAAAVTGTAISLSWDSVTGAAWYRLYAADSSDGSPPAADAYSTLAEIQETSYRDAGLAELATRYYRVSACMSRDIDSCTPPSDAISATTATAPPTGLTVNNVGNTNTLSWTAVAGVTHYRLFRSTAFNGPYSELAVISSGITYDDTGVSGTDYYYRLAACIGAVDAPIPACSMESDYVTTAPLPDAPTALSATVIGDAVTLSWTGVAGADGSYYYRVWRGSQSDGSDRNLITGASGQPPHPLTTAGDRYSDNAAEPATSYYYWLETCNNNGCSDYSSGSGHVRYFSMRLNDTTIRLGGNATAGNQGGCRSDISLLDEMGDPTGVKPPQDCDHGRDAEARAGTLDKAGGGVAGFDFTKLASDGTALADQQVAWDERFGSEAANSRWSCVRDNHTGLVWEVKTNDSSIHRASNLYNWGGVSAAGREHSQRQGRYNDGWNSLVNGSNSSSFCGRTDWRVPTVKELGSIIRRRTSPVIDQGYFPNTDLRVFWSSTADVADTAHALAVDFNTSTYDYDIVSLDRSVPNRVRLVSGSHESISSEPVTPVTGQTQHAWLPNTTPDSRYVVVGDDTVIDRETGLMWQRCAAGLTGVSCSTGVPASLDWAGALRYAAEAMFAGYDDWRLPNINELHSLAAYDREPILNISIFPSPTTATGIQIWSSSPTIHSVNNAGVRTSISVGSRQRTFINDSLRNELKPIRLVRTLTAGEAVPDE